MNVTQLCIKYLHIQVALEKDIIQLLTTITYLCVVTNERLKASTCVICVNPCCRPMQQGVIALNVHE